MAIDWTLYYRRILALSAQGFSQAQIAEHISEETGEVVTRDAVRHALERAREQIPMLKEMPVPDRIPYVSKYKEYIDGTLPPKAKDWEVYRKAKDKADCKVLVQSDLHIPFHDESLISDSIEKHLDADVYCGVADFLDCYSMSVFMKSEDIPLIFEIDEALRFLEYLSNTFEVVVLLEANHEDRVRKRILNMLPPEIQFMAKKHILAQLAAPFPNIFVESEMWFYQFGSVLFTHPEKASRVELKAAMSVYEHFIEWQDAYDLADWNCIVVAHTHQMGVGYANNVKVIEVGCLSKPQAYAFNPKIPYKRPHQNGYAVLHLNKGEADLNRCREYKYFGLPNYKKRNR